MKVSKKHIIGVLMLSTVMACQVVIDPEPLAEDAVQGMAKLSVPHNFNYEAMRMITVSIEVENRPALAFILQTPGGNTLLQGQTDSKGLFTTEIAISSEYEALQLVFQAVGIPQKQALPIKNNQASFVMVNRPDGGRRSESDGLQATVTPITGNYYALGTWDDQGKPDYLIASDVVPSELLDDINASLPENQPVPSFRPEYLVDQNMDLSLTDSADVWVTFVHEGAGYKNTLGYYTYPLDTPPANKEAIDSLFIIFPNLSFTGSGGDLATGNKVHLGRFAPNTGIGWFLIPNGWNAAAQTIVPSTETKYSSKSFNNYTATNYQQHAILLNDVNRELLLLGFEDITRPAGDNDFNDAIFYITANPFSAIVTDNFNDITASVDTDGDGALDHTEQYPNDPTKAFDAYSPSQNTFGTLAFEDLWPNKGDYDFNDLVVDYQFKRTLSTNYKVQEWEATIRVKAIGGAYHNGFGIELPCETSQVISVAGNQITENYLNMAPNGVEAGQSKAVIIAFDDAFAIMPPINGNRLVNAELGKGYKDPVTLTIQVDFTDDALNNSQFANSPYNPFIIANMRRGYEVHLPGQQPTALATTNLFQTADDASELGTSNTYKNILNHPWALHLSSSFAYPKEGADISNTHLKFKNWAESGGSQFTDWTQDKTGYRHGPFIYQP